MDGFDEEFAAAEAAGGRTPGEKATTATALLPPLSSLVELKTLKWPEPGRDWALFNLKAPTWWLQCFLGGVENLRLGGRDDRGVLRSLDALAVSALPGWAASSCSRGHPRWTAEGIAEHGAGVLDWVVRAARWCWTKKPPCTPG